MASSRFGSDVYKRQGIDTSLQYLKNFGIIKEDGKDNFVTSDENRETNDENLAAMGLGAMTNGLTALDMTGAYAALANGGKDVYKRQVPLVKDFLKLI